MLRAREPLTRVRGGHRERGHAATVRMEDQHPCKRRRGYCVRHDRRNGKSPVRGLGER